MKTKPIKLERKLIPNEMAEIAYGRVSPLLEKYHREKAIVASSLKSTLVNEFDLKELCISCYTQGLSDGNQLPKQKIKK